MFFFFFLFSEVEAYIDYYLLLFNFEKHFSTINLIVKL